MMAPKKVSVLPCLIEIILISVYTDITAQNAIDREHIRKGTDIDALTGIVEAKNRNYQSDLTIAIRRGIPLIILNQRGDKGYFCALLKNGPSYYFDDSAIRSYNIELKRPSQLNKKQVRKTGLPRRVTGLGDATGYLYAISEDGHPIYYFKKIN